MADVPEKYLNHIDGENKGDVLIYALSTCGWCRKTKDFLTTHHVDYSYVDVDQVPDGEREAVIEKQRSHNPGGSFPTIVVNGDKVIVGYDMVELEELADGKFE